MAKVIERTYNVPLRKEYRKVPRWRKTKKAVKALREFLVKHMKSENISIGEDVNNELWKHGIRNPPHHIKVNCAKNDKGEVKVSLFGVQKAEPKKKEAKSAEKKPESKKEAPKEEKKEVSKEEKKPETTDKKAGEKPKSE